MRSKDNLKITALYEKLSKYDEQNGESNRITSQVGIFQVHFHPQVRKSKNNALELLNLSEIRSVGH